MQTFLDQLYKTSWLEVIAMVCGLLFPVFSAFEKKICWLFGGMSSVIYVYICFNGKLYQDAFLNFYYIIMAVVGYLIWQGVIKSKKGSLKISFLKPKFLLLYLFLGLVYTVAGGYFFHEKTDASYPYVDAFVTGFSFIGTFLEAKKKIENWYIFLVADGVGAWLFYQKGLMLTSILFTIFCFICIYGIIQWHRKIKLSRLP
jgi:nicotinamide mononucleotide transporter